VNSKFNPYHAWLDLPLEVKRPNYYQLLRVPEFESDVQKVTAAADRALARVRGHQPGDQATAWSKLLDELTAARKCLGDPAKKQAYDLALKKQHAQSANGSPAGGQKKPQVASVNSSPDLYPPGMAPKAANSAAKAPSAKPKQGPTTQAHKKTPAASPKSQAAAKIKKPTAGSQRPTKATRQSGSSPATKTGKQAAPAANKAKPADKAATPQKAAPTGEAAERKAAPAQATKKSPDVSGATPSKTRSGLVNAHVAPPQQPKRSVLPLVLGIAAVFGLLTFGMLYLALHSVW
jgi:hypothetical protein